jgi:hypothetical protein
MSAKANVSMFLGVVVVVGLALLAGAWPDLTFTSIPVGDLPSRFAGLLFFALLIERAVEVVLSIPRAEQSNKLHAKVQQLVAAKKAADDTDLVAAQQQLIEYRADTLQIAIPLSLFFGLIVASLGVRLMGQFVVTTGLGPTQTRAFHAADIILTATLLCGGADPIHKVLDTFRKFMESSSAKAGGQV